MVELLGVISGLLLYILLFLDYKIRAAIAIIGCSSFSCKSFRLLLSLEAREFKSSLIGWVCILLGSHSRILLISLFASHLLLLLLLLILLLLLLSWLLLFLAERIEVKLSRLGLLPSTTIILKNFILSCSHIIPATAHFLRCCFEK